MQALKQCVQLNCIKLYRCSPGRSIVNAASRSRALDWQPPLLKQRREGWEIRVSTILAAD